MSFFTKIGKDRIIEENIPARFNGQGIEAIGIARIEHRSAKGFDNGIVVYPSVDIVQFEGTTLDGRNIQASAKRGNPAILLEEQKQS